MNFSQRLRTFTAADRSVWLRAVALFALLILIVGCGGGSSDGGDGGNGSGGNSGGNNSGGNSGSNTARITGRVVDRNSLPEPDGGVAGAQVTGAITATTNGAGTFDVTVPAGTSGNITVNLPTNNGTALYYGGTITTPLVLRNSDGTIATSAQAGAVYNLDPIVVYNVNGPPPPPPL